MTAPRLNDYAALKRWVDRQLQLTPPPRDYLVEPWHKFHRPFSGPPEDHELEAIEAARQGNFKLLGALLDRSRFSNRPQRLSVEAEDLIAAYLQGKFKAPRKRPKQSAARRRANNPVFAAADEVAFIQKLLERQFPEQRKHRARAITLAADRANMNRETLARHLRMITKSGS